MPSSHDYIKDKRNKNIKIFVNDKFYTRDKAKVSVFDSGFLLGDGVWSGIRYHNNTIPDFGLFNWAVTVELTILKPKILRKGTVINGNTGMVSTNYISKHN